MSITRSILKFHVFCCQHLGLESRFLRFHLISSNGRCCYSFGRLCSCTLVRYSGHNCFLRSRRRWVRHSWIDVILRVDIDRDLLMDRSIRTACIVRSSSCQLLSYRNRLFGFVDYRCIRRAGTKYCVIAIRNFLKDRTWSYSHQIKQEFHYHVLFDFL